MSKTAIKTRGLTRDEMDQFEFLDNLRDSGKTNMFGSPLYLVKEFEIDRSEARRVVSLWMRNCGKDYENMKVDMEI